MKRNLRYLLVIVGLAVLSLMVMDFNNRINELGRLTEQRAQVGQQVTQLSATNIVLQTQIANATSETAVREEAYGQERRIGPDEVLIVPLPAGEAAPQVTPTPEAAPITYQNWQYWYALFFEARP
jgi:cell division protein FtsB